LINNPSAAPSVAAKSATASYSASDRDAMTRNAGYLTRAPKGLFFYSSAEEMDADRRRWTVDAVVDKARERSK
jgi:hypothetical protein